MKKRVITQEIEIDYENGFTCNYTMIDNEVNEYHFSYGFDSVCYIDDISNYKQNPNKDLCFSEEGLLSFDEFDKLFFVSRNNYLRDPKTKKFIPTLIHYKSTYKNKLKCKAFINSLDQKYIKNISILIQLHHILPSVHPNIFLLQLLVIQQFHLPILYHRKTF